MLPLKHIATLAAIQYTFFSILISINSFKYKPWKNLPFLQLDYTTCTCPPPRHLQPVPSLSEFCQKEIQCRFKLEYKLIPVNTFQNTNFNTRYGSYPFCSWNLYSWARNSFCFTDVFVGSVYAINMWCHVVNAKKLASRRWLWVNKQAIKITRSIQLQSKNTLLRLY